MSPAGFGLGAGYTPVEEVEETDEVATSELMEDENPAMKEPEEGAEISEDEPQEDLTISD